VTPESYARTLKKYDADFYTSFGVETHQHSAKKRKLKANELSLQWLDKTIQLITPEEAVKRDSRIQLLTTSLIHLVH